LNTCRIVTLLLGTFIISFAVYLATVSEVELFDTYLIISSIIGMPIVMPFTIALLVKKLPHWAYFFIFGACLVPSIWAWVDNRFFDGGWEIHHRILWILAASLIATLLCRPFYRFSPVEYRTRIDAFFVKMRTPIRFAEEVGEANDHLQMRMMGRVTIVGGCVLMLLLLLPNSFTERLGILFVCGFVQLVGALLLWRSRKASREHAANALLGEDKS
jgi:hypothetical protein